MAPRRSHKKSRGGCKTCKRRHIKCDEHRPKCSYCVRTGSDCIWPLKTSASTDSNIPGSNSVPDAVEQCFQSATHIASGGLSGAGSKSGPLQVGDLALLHHFTTVTYATLNNMDSQQHIWQDVIVRIGFKYHFVLRSILALAALHQATILQGKSAELYIQASTHLNLALQDFHKELSDVNPTNCNAIFAFSSITVVHAFVAAVNHLVGDALAALLDCLRLVRGVTTVLLPHYTIMVDMELAPLVRNGMRKDVAGEIPEVLRLRDLVKPDNDEATREVYLHAINQLHETYLQVLACGQEASDQALLMTWPATVSEKFFALMSARDPVALVILAYFASLFRHIRFCWWLEGWHGRVLIAIESEVGAKYSQWLQWPKRDESLSVNSTHDIDHRSTD